jgi:hypothetical protein
MLVVLHLLREWGCAVIFTGVNLWAAGHGSRVVWGMYCLLSLGSQDHGFESHARHGCLVCVCVFLCLWTGRDLAKSWSLVQGVLPVCKMIMKLKNQRPGTKGAVGPVKKKLWAIIWELGPSERVNGEDSSLYGIQLSRCLPPYPRTETDPVSETSCSLEYQTMDKSKSPVILSVIHQRQNRLEFTRKLHFQRTSGIYMQMSNTDICSFLPQGCPHKV